MLQIFNGFNALGQLGLDGGQGLFGQRGTSFGGIALPGQSICQIELARCQQRIGLVSPFRSNRNLPLAALELIELFLQRLGCALVTIGEVFIDLGHDFCGRLCCQPGANARSALARCRCRKSPARQAVKWMHV